MAWLEGFLKRNKKISVRKPEATSINRITAFNKPEVTRFYENLENVMKTYNFQPDRNFNVDETGVTMVHEPGPVLSEKGVKQVGAATSGERGKTHTACCCVSESAYQKLTSEQIPSLFRKAWTKICSTEL